MTSLARLTDLTDNARNQRQRGKCQGKIPVISRHGLSCATSDPSDRSDLSDNVRGNPRSRLLIDSAVSELPVFGRLCLKNA